MPTMRRVGRTLVTTALLGVTLTGLGAVGTANAAPSTAAMTVAAAEQSPPREFRDKFPSERDCLDRGERDFPGQRDRWECRQGPDRDRAWEFWAN